MNPITRAIDVVKFRIPRLILDEVFQNQGYYTRGVPISIDERMLAAVVRPRVLVDCSLVGGAEVLIDLDGIPGEFVNMFETIYRVPKSRTQGRSIISCLSVGYGTTSQIAQTGGTTGFRPGSVTPITQGAQSITDSFSPVPAISTAKCSMIGENVILIKDTNPPVANAYLRCVIAHDENMSHLQPRTIPAFTKLVELAVKAYVYNEMSVRIDQAFLSGGQTLGRFKEIVDEYRDAEEMYNTYLLEKWTKIELMNDREAHNRFIRIQTGTNH